MSLDLSSIFSETDGILNDLLSKYKSLRFIGFNQDNDNAREYITPVITSGFYYKARKQPITGEVVERLRIVPQSSTVDSAIQEGAMVELSDSNGSFTRFKIKVIREPQPPTMEWFLELTPNKADKSVIT